MKARVWVYACCVFAWGSGCQLISSEDLETKDIRVAARFIATGTGETRIEVTLGREGSIDERVELAEGDRLEAISGGDGVLLTETEDAFNDISYVATLDGDEPGKKFVLKFQRDEHEDASAEASLPEPFQLTAPKAGTAYDADLPIPVQWEGGKAASEMRLFYSLDCRGESAAGVRYEEDDGETELVSDGDWTPPCHGRLKASRRLEGDLEGHWSGEVSGDQQVEIELDLK